MTSKTFRGELHDQAGKYVGMIHAADGGYIIRNPKPFAGNIGPVMFNGRVFKGADFEKAGSTDLGYARVKYYRLRPDVQS